MRTAEDKVKMTQSEEGNCEEHASLQYGDHEDGKPSAARDETF